MQSWRDYIARHYDPTRRQFIRLEEANCARAAAYLERGEMPPPETIKHAVAKLRAETVADRGGKRGGDPRRDVPRNVIITLAVYNVSKELGIRPTRNEATDAAASGCSIVKDWLDELGLALSEKRIGEIYAATLKELDLVPIE